MITSHSRIRTTMSLVGNKICVAFVAMCCLAACIGDDYILDTVDENVRISVHADTLAVGDSFRFEAVFTNAVGVEESADVQWSCDNTEIATIDNDGLTTGIMEGQVVIRAQVAGQNATVSDSVLLNIADTTVISEATSRTGTLRTTSSYTLKGAFELSRDGDMLTLALAEDYRASSSLPGLYVYLSNNPNSTSGAFEIGRVEVFSGAHQYTFSTSQAMLDQYSHVLYFCKPFNVKVGDGPFDN